MVEQFNTTYYPTGSLVTSYFSFLPISFSYDYGTNTVTFNLANGIYNSQLSNDNIITSVQSSIRIVNCVPTNNQNSATYITLPSTSSILPAYFLQNS